MKSFSRSMVVAFALAMCLVSSARVTAQDPTAKIIEFGRYKGTVVGLTPTEDVVSGSVKVTSNGIAHLETTKKIPSKVGELFGFRVAFSNLPKNRAYTVKSEMHHPAIKQPDGESLTKSVSEAKYDSGEEPDGFYAWHFLKGFEYELVPGKWTRKIFIDGKEVATMTFDVEK